MVGTTTQQPPGASATEEEIIRSLSSLRRKAQEENEAYDQSSCNFLYEDEDFSPYQLTTLYINPEKLPDYASSIDKQEDELQEEEGSSGASGAGGVYWYRPTEYTDDPDYFKSTSGCGILREGDLHDAWLLGVFAAIALHPANLIENLFVSDSLNAFKEYGVYSCRFYKDNQWVTVMTDTRVPYSMELQPEDKYPAKGCATSGNVLYGSSLNKNEVFIPFLEKCYAKLHGSYQAIAEGTGGNTSAKILEAFLDCTGGCAHRVDLYDARLKMGDDVAHNTELWKQMLRYRRKKCILTAQIKQLSFNTNEQTSTGILKNRQYVLQHLKEVSVSGGNSNNSTPALLRFVKLKNVWGRGMWKGEWSNDDSKWEENVQVENAMRNDPACEFSRSGQDGCFWMIWEDFLDIFNEVFVVHVFANDEIYQYSVQGEWVGHTAAGAPAKSGTSGGGSSNDHLTTNIVEKPIEKTKWAVVSDAEPNWHRNPQYKLTVSDKTTGVLISLCQRDFRLYGGDNYAVNFVVMREKLARSSIVWEFNRHHIVAEAHSYDTNDLMATLATSSSALPVSSGGSAGGGSVQSKQLPEREILKEDLVLEPDVAYFIIPYTDNPKVEMEFFLRVFSPKPVRVEHMPTVFSCVTQGKWRNDEEESGEPMNAGGPLCHQLSSGEENTAWCQNPQFWLHFPYCTKKKTLAALLKSKAHVTLKVIVKKTSHKASTATKNRQRESSKEKGNLVGVTAVRAAHESENADTSDPGGSGSGKASHACLRRAQAKQSKTNFLGEVIEKNSTKAQKSMSSAKAHDRNDRETDKIDDDDLQSEAKESSASNSLIIPPAKLVVHPDEWCRVSDYSNVAIACMYLRKIPKEWLQPDPTSATGGGGLMLVPTLGEPAIEGTFDLQIDSDFPVEIDPLSKFASQSLPGEWTEANATGCHLHSNWKKNPKFYIHLKGLRPAKVKITLTRSELEWKTKCKRDSVGTMIGFYVFHGQKFSREPSAVASSAGAIMYNGRHWTETDFVPLHSVSTPPDLILPSAFNEPYVIMPATYEPGKLGKFVVSVQSDTEFSLSSDME